MIGAQVTQQLLPGGPADVIYVIGADGMRAVCVKGGMSGQPEGTILLTMNTGDVIQLNPKNKTYWKSSMTDMAATMQSLGMQPEVTVTPARETATVAGVQARRSDYQVSIPLPIPPEMRAQMPPGVPTAIVMSGEMWSATTPFEKYLPTWAKAAPLLANGITMRQVVRSDLFGGQQLEMAVTQIGEETMPAGLFAIPSDFKEVPSPIK